MKPNLIIIGTQKCGTSSLHHYLNLHPEVSMSHVKELDFFVDSLNWDKGNDWYESHFTGGVKVYGESSPSYTMYPNFKGVPQRMYSMLPDAKLIYIVRDPIDRIISHYLHQWYRKRQNENIQNALLDINDERTKHYINTSNYYLQITQYLKYYDISRIHILGLEELQNNRDETLRIVFKFLSIDDTFLLPNDTRILNKTHSKIRTNKLGDILLSDNQLFKSFRTLASRITPPSMKANLKSLIGSKQSNPTISDVLFEALREALQDDINKFRDLTGKNFQEWSI